jgi:quercetin dioxygenase-like cupin family protein
MDFPSSGARGFFEILMPGVFLLINLLIFVFCPLLGFADTSAREELFKSLSGNAYSLAFLICFGYLIGVVLRVFRTQWADDWSAKVIARFSPNERNLAYVTDPFFYGNWVRAKCSERLPAGAAQFYDDFWKDKFGTSAMGNTTFYNFCKGIIAKYDEQSAREIFAGEALSRFISGSLFALIISLVLALLNGLVMLIGRVNWMAEIAFAAAVLYAFLALGILLRFRFIRCKEVDTVFAACFANRQEFEKLLPKRSDQLKQQVNPPNERYLERKSLLECVWERIPAGEGLPALSLDQLIALMKERSASKSYLSSIYFAGADIDHPFFLKNDKVAIGIAVLPEDAEKAGKRKRHPHQVEIGVVLRGKLCLHMLEKNQERSCDLKEGDEYVIQRDVCHWITAIPNTPSAFLFLKTNPAQEPRGVDC